MLVQAKPINCYIMLDNVPDDILKIVYVQQRDYQQQINRMAENLTKVPKRGILKQSTSFEQRGEEK